MIALDASFIVVGPQGIRTIAARDFFVGLFTTALAFDEIVTEIAIPMPEARTSGAYLKLERKVGDFATAGVAAQVTIDEHDSCTRVGIGLTNVGATPIMATEAHSFLQGKPLDEPTIAQASELVAAAADPVADRRGSSEYKRDIVRVLAKRALRLAARRAMGLEQSGGN
jgi:carbon-monoxide dehydrogenase medium subunit